MDAGDHDMQFVETNGAKLAYLDEGMGEPVLLIHGFASRARVNWVDTGWTKVLHEAGFRTIAADNRGHGESEKFYTPEDYGPDIFAADLIGLLDHLDIERCHVIGYSMGARITAWLAMHHANRISRAVMGGMGSRLVGPPGDYEHIAAALETDQPEMITDRQGRAFRTFADATGSDRRALAACIRPSRERITAQDVATITVPLLIVCGGYDEVSGSAEELAALIPTATALTIPGFDHMKATGARPFKEAAVDFLKGEAA